MSAPQGMLEGQSMNGPPYFNGQHYSWWKNRMENYIQAEDYELWMLIVNDPYILVKVTTDGKTVPKEPKDSTQTTSGRWRRMPRPRNCCILNPDLTSTLASQNVNLQRRYEMLFK